MANRSNRVRTEDDPDRTYGHVRSRIYHGGRQLLARQIAGSVLRLVSVLVVTRLIGPSAYGYFAAGAIVLGVLSTVATFGVDVDLVRVVDVDRRDENVAFTFIFGLAIAVGAAALIAAPLYGRWIGDDVAVAPLRALVLLVPLAVFPVPARARLERTLEFGKLAVVELLADLVVVAVAVPLALAGSGVWAPVAGLMARLLWLAVALPRAAKLPPRLAWDRARVRAFVRFGGRYSLGRWMTMTANLVNPLLIGRLAGPVGVAHVAIATRIIEQLGAVKQVAVRLATPALSRVRDNPARLAAAHAEGSLLQALGAVPAYAAAAFAAPWVLPRILGSTWSSAAELVALLAMAASVGTVFNLHAPVLYVLNRPGAVARVRVLQLLAFVTGTLTLVPALGIAGYGGARLLRCLPFGLLHHQLRSIFRPNYGPMLRWLIGFVPPMFSYWLPETLRPLLLLPLVVVVALPASRSELRSLIDLVLWRLRSRPV